MSADLPFDLGGPCPDHGGRRHTTVHEAGHLLAAVEHGLEVDEVLIHHQPQPLPGDNTDVRSSGWVSINQTALETAPAAALLDVAFAGRAAELAVLGHATPDGHEADITRWRQRFGFFSAGFDDTATALMGEHPNVIVDRTKVWATTQARHLDRLARRLARGGRWDGAAATELVAATRTEPPMR